MAAGAARPRPEGLKQDVAAKLRSLGLAAAAGGAGPEAAGGFDDRDFRPPGPSDSASSDSSPPEDEPSAGPPRRSSWVDPKTQGAGPRPETLGREPHRWGDEADGAAWHEALAALPAVEAKGGAKAKSKAKAKGAPPTRWARDSPKVERCRAEAEAAVAAAAAGFQRRMARQGGADARWLQKAKEAGTVSDKVAAATLLLRESAVANLGSLDMLLNWVTRNKGGKNVVGQAVEALKELFATGVLLPDRKLRFFHDQPLPLAGKGEARTQRLLYWHIEDCIKTRYFRFVEGVEALSRDNLPFLKEKALAAAFELLRGKSENEARHLTILVNKLGDPDRKVASKAGFFLGEVLAEHPMMKAVVVKEVEYFLFRPGLKVKARYAGVIFLTQIMLSRREAEGGSELAEKLIQVYVTLFDVCMQDADRELAVARRRDRALNLKAKAKKKKPPGGKGKGKGGDGKGAPPGGPGGESQIDSRMLSALLTGINRAFPFVAQNRVEDLVAKHSPMLFKLVHGPNFTAAVQALLLLYQIMNVHMATSDRFYRALYAAMEAPEVLRSTKTPQLLALVFKAAKADPNSKRVAAFLKRLLQVSAEASANLACGTLLIVSEVLKRKPALWAMVKEAEDEQEGEEHFADVRAEDDGVEEGGGAGAAEAGDGRGAAPPRYDLRKRDPVFCGADRTCIWELSVLAQHVHPSVAAMAKTLLAGANVAYSGDPLRDLNMSAFLAKFVTKKAKEATGGRNAGSLHWRGVGGSGSSRALVGTRQFLDQLETDVRPEDVFFHKFYRVHVEKGGGLQTHGADAAGGLDLLDAAGAEAADEAEADAALDEFEAAETEGGRVDEGFSYDDLAEAYGDSDAEADEEGAAELGLFDDVEIEEASEEEESEEEESEKEAQKGGRKAKKRRPADEPDADLASFEDYAHLIGAGEAGAAAAGGREARGGKRRKRAKGGKKK